MNSQKLIESFQELKELKNINRPTMMKVLEEVLRTIIRRKFGTDENCDVIVNGDKGDLEIWRTRQIVENGQVEDPHLQLDIKQAKALQVELNLDDEDIEIGADIYERIFIDDFGRRAVLAARQTLKSKIVEIEKDELFKNYKDKIGEIITGEVYQIWKREILIMDDEGNELSLPKTEMIKRDFFKKGDPIRAIIKDVELRNNSPIIKLSRTDNEFLAKLLELEVPEIFDGLITIKRIARSPGERAKVAVESYDERIDPVGACVGMKGSRIHGIVRELRNENIDIIPFTDNTSLFIQRCLTPAKINSMRINEETRKASVYLDPEEVSKAIGKNGLNIKLASKLTNYQIDVFRDTEDIEEFDDIELQEFADEIDQWIIDALMNIGCDTARSVLRLKPEEVMRRADLEEETVTYLFNILTEEFQDNNTNKEAKPETKKIPKTSTEQQAKEDDKEDEE